MKNLISAVLVLAILGSCRKDVQDSISDPTEGAYEVIIYDQTDNVVFRGTGTAFYVVVNNGTQIRLDDPNPIQTFSTNTDKVAYILLQLNHQLNAPATMDTSGFSGGVGQGWYISDWDYHTKSGNLKITEVVQNKIKGEFTITLSSGDSPNHNWGNNIKIKGKFYARCGGYGC
jgi:hypothetical protein